MSESTNQDPSQDSHALPDSEDASAITRLTRDLKELDLSLIAILESRLEIYRELAELEGAPRPAEPNLKRDPARVNELRSLTDDLQLQYHLPTLYHEVKRACIAAQLEHLARDPDESTSMYEHEEEEDTRALNELDDLSELDDLNKLSRFNVSEGSDALDGRDAASDLSDELDERRDELSRPKRRLSSAFKRQLGRFKRVKGRERARFIPLTESQRQWLTTTGFAHRGLHDALAGIPENSLASFERALEEGYGIELDVHLSRDLIPVVFHDEELERMTGLNREVRALTLNELKTLELIPGGHQIPTLAEALAYIAGRAPVLVEVKNHGEPVGEIESAVYEVLKTYQGPVCVQSFNPISLAWFRRHASEVIRGLISYRFPIEEVPLPATTRFLLKNIMLTPICKPHYIAYNHQDLARDRLRRLRRMRARGTPVLAWTITNESEARLARHHADNLIFEGFALAEVAMFPAHKTPLMIPDMGQAEEPVKSLEGQAESQAESQAEGQAEVKLRVKLRVK